MGTMQTGGTVIGSMPAIFAWRLVIVEARIVVDSVVGTPFCRRFPPDLRRLIVALSGIRMGRRILRPAIEGADGGEHEARQEKGADFCIHVGLRYSRSVGKACAKKLGLTDLPNDSIRRRRMTYSLHAPRSRGAARRGSPDLEARRIGVGNFA